MSALSAIEAPVDGGPGTADGSRADGGSLGTGEFRRAMRLVGDAIRTGGGSQPCSSSIRPGAHEGPARRVVAPGAVVRGPSVARPAAGGSPTPVRLTRRGRIVVAGLVLACLTVAALLISLLASGGAQATNHGQARAGFQGMHEVVVRPGQTLWSIASAAEPTADTRAVVQEIMTANALTSANISAGQLIWIPR
jgi:hypothetical protein